MNSGSNVLRTIVEYHAFCFLSINMEINLKERTTTKKSALVNKYDNFKKIINADFLSSFLPAKLIKKMRFPFSTSIGNMKITLVIHFSLIINLDKAELYEQNFEMEAKEL